MQLLSLYAGKPVKVTYREKPLETGIYKQPVHGKVFLGKTNLEGDGQADLVNHGGTDKAVCVYCHEHYAYWEQRWGRKLDGCAFGENFTVTGMTESDVCIGDVFEIGSAHVQISQPRQPCYKVAHKQGLTELTMWMQESGYTGYYFRVLKEGAVEAGQPFRLAARDAAGITIAEANRLKYHDKSDTEGIRRLLEVSALSVSWRESFEKRIRS
ncbi:MOSC domain-containing protein [Paenibacillus allorhizosphaerae]|uniref:Protein YiiM n=1 Tax=Paenibacillus allorhizosphaerae TaxID=2849866 RepID=A0ABM8VLR2_9BACL|nr:MOSC domain-containing protein [Paenibacillus allorhizosphaerae]CAG7648951.1 Protein YiiM [Paenibacillus allorhizosphaerae]